jgi:hypothetical protein
MDELKPCPFCGSHDIDQSFWMAGELGDRRGGPGCNNCGATSEPEYWNARPLEDAAAAREKALREALEAVEWVYSPSDVDTVYKNYGEYYCPFCDGEKPNHSSDCSRQAALALTQEQKP